MTKQLTISGTKPHMELDLDSFLNSHSTSDSDSPTFLSVPHRTLDEILNDSDSDSDSDSSTPLPPPSQNNLTRRSSDLPPSSQNYVVSQDSTTQAQTSVNFFAPAKSVDPVWRAPVPTSSSSTSRPLPSLFGGVRSNAKPGAALAAAAAASRSMLTPHAAAIKSRRASSASSGTAENVLDIVESASTVSDDHDAVSSIERSTSGEKLVEEDEKLVKDKDISRKGEKLVEEDEKLVKDKDISRKGEKLEINSEVLNSNRDVQTEVEFQVEAEHVLRVEESGIQDDHSRASSPSCTDDKDENVSLEKDNSELLDVNRSSTIEIGNGVNNEEDSAAVLLEELATDTNGHGDDVENDIAELVEERIGRLESEMTSKRAEKKLKPFLKPLELAEELESKQAYTGLHWEEGAAAQPMRLEGVRRGSTTLGYFDVNVNNVVTGIISSKGFRRDYGSPQALAVHVNYIAVGMSKGVIVVVPSRYSSHNVDNMDAKMLMLGLQGDRSHAAVTSICFNQQGDLLLAGYGDGHITIWDVQKASAAKVITGEHTAPVVHTFFLGQDSQFTRQFKAITGDSKGLVLLHISSVFPLLNRFSIKSQCLLDGQKTGTVLSASPLLFEESYGGALPISQGSVSASSSGIGSMMGGVVGGEAGWKLFNEGSSLVEEGVVIFATCQTALVVRLTPTLKIYAQLSKPDGVREGSLPYTAWKCTQHSLNSSNDNIPTSGAADRVSLLAVAWDRKVQVAKLVQKELKVYGNWSLDSTAIGVAWLDDHMLVILTLTGKLLLFAKDGTLIHQTSFDVDGYGGDDLIACHTHFTNIFGNPEKAYQNCVAVRGASVYILGPTRLIVSRLLPWKEQIHVLRSAGDWMGALNMAMTLYDGHAHGVIDLPKSVDAVREAIMPYLAELLLSYVDEVFSYISVAFGIQIGKVEQQDGSKSESSSVHNEIKEQFTRVGGVAVEYCVHIQRTDILFDEVYSKFVAVQHRDTFLELLEPYILRDMLGSLPPEIMQALVEHYSAKGWLLRVEQCVLHMDISSLDFNQVVRLCREHGLYGALVYLFNKGLDDFRAPLEELLIVSRNAEKETASLLGYRMLVYLKYCFTGLAFPPGHGVLPPTRLPSLRAELVQFLLEKSDASNIQAAANLSSRPMFLNLHHLLVLDTEATLDVLRCAFVDDKNPMNDLSSHVGASSNMDVMQESGAMDESPNLLVQNTINALVIIIEKHIFEARESTRSDDIGSGEAWPSKKDVGHLFEFIAYYVSCRKACVSQSVLSQILEYLTAEVSFPPNIPTNSTEISKEREKQVLALLEAVPESDWKASHVLQLCEQADFYQVCGLIYTIRHQYLAAMDSYMKDIDEPLHTFSYINNMLEELNEKELDTFRSAVLARIPELVILSRECTFMLIVDHFNIEDPEILSKLRANPKSLFLYLKTVIEVHSSGTLDFSYLGKDDNIEPFNGRRVRDAYFEKISAFPKVMRNNPIHVTDDMVELYFELLCQYERNSVLKFLETFDSYRVEQCLRLCQEHGIIDAAAFLLERVGDVGSALLLTLSGLDDYFSELETAVESVLSKKNLNGSTNIDHFSTLLNMEEVENIRTVLHACIGLCQRNTPRLQPDESEILWFRLLDSFCEPLMDSYSDKSTLKGKNYVGMLAAETLGSQGDDEALVIKWKISKSHKGAHILRKLFSVFIKDIVEGMIGYVRLPTIMSKLLSDNGSQEFGDFKITILGMLGTYGFERRILNTAKSLIEDDTFYTMSLLKKGASHGYAPRGVICCICNCPLAKNSSFRIRVFSCGHATHLDCEVLEGESSSKVHLSGCPVCMPKKNTQAARNRSAVPDNGLLNTAPNRPQRAPGNSVLHPNDDFYENTYGLQQISRFEILSNLQKDQRLVQIETMPQLRLAPPAVYHEKVKKGSDLLTGESSITKIEKPSKKQLRELKIKASALRFPLKSSIFSKEKTTKR